MHYNLERIRNIDFTNSKDLFIHGMIGNSNGGTCVSMPVLYTAVARRLGYPVTLVRAKAHVFCRWEGVGERWNIEATAGGGIDSFADEYYTQWPQQITQQEIERGEYLRALSAAEALALFLATRGHCLLDIGRVHEAQAAYARACQLDPSSHEYHAYLADAMRRTDPHLRR